VTVARGAAREKRPLGWMGAGIGAVGDAITIHVKVAAKFLTGVQLCGRHYLTAVISARVVPGKRLRQVMVHAVVEIEHDENRRLQPVGKIESLCAEIEGL